MQAENAALRVMLGQAGLDASRLLQQAGIIASENEAAARLQRLLLEELHHRVKNTLAMVMSITHQSLKNTASLEEGRRAIEQRLTALGRTHDLLLQTNWRSADLTQVVAAAIEPFNTSDQSRFLVQKFRVEIGPSAVLTLALALNELCTNAVKYGALSNATGRVEITSHVDDETQWFRLVWQEIGGPPVATPVRRSFGTRLIQSSLPRLLDGQAGLRFEPAGLICEFDFPVAAIQQTSLA